MLKLLRAYYHNVGFENLWWKDGSLGFRNPKTEEGEHTFVCAGNGGGKSTAIALLLSTLDPDIKNFLRTRTGEDEAGFVEYFDDHYYAPGVVLLEFDAGEEVLLHQQVKKTLVVGQIVCLRRDSDSSIYRRFFCFETKHSMSAETLIQGSKERGLLAICELKSLKDAKDWLSTLGGEFAGDLGSSRKGGFYSTDLHKEWRNHLDLERGIDSGQVDIQRLFNRAEKGQGVKDVFDYKSEKDFLDSLIKFTYSDELCKKLSSTVSNVLMEMKEIPKFKKRKKAVVELMERFGPFRAKSNLFVQAEENEKRLFAEACKAYTSLRLLQEQSNLKKTDIQSKLDNMAARISNFINIIDALEVEERGTQSALEDLYIAKLGAELSQAEKGLSQSSQKLEELLARELLSEIEAKETRRSEIAKNLASEKKELGGLLEDLQIIGNQLNVLMIQVESEIETKVKALGHERSLIKKSLDNNQSNKNTLAEKRGEHKANVAQALKMLSKIKEEFESLVADEIVMDEESVKEALERVLLRARDLLSGISANKEEGTRIEAQIDVHRDNLLKIQKSLENKDNLLGNAKDRITHIQKTKSKLQEDFYNLGVTEVKNPTLETATLLSELKKKIARTEGYIADKTVELSALQTDIQSIDAYNVLGVDHNTTKVVEALQMAKQYAKPFAQYLSDIYKGQQEEARKIYFSDPSRFSGVQVRDKEVLEIAQSLMIKGLDRPVVVSTFPNSIEIKNTDDVLVISPEGHALYSVEDAEMHLQSLENKTQEIEEAITTLKSQKAALDVLLMEYETYCVKLGDEKLNKLGSEKTKLKTQIKTLCEKKETEKKELKGLDKLKKTNENEARHLHEDQKQCLRQQVRLESYQQSYSEEGRLAQIVVESSGNVLAEMKSREHALNVEMDVLTQKAETVSSALVELEKELKETLDYRKNIELNSKLKTPSTDQNVGQIREAYKAKHAMFIAKQTGNYKQLKADHDSIKDEITILSNKYERDYSEYPRDHIAQISVVGIDAEIIKAKDAKKSSLAYMSECRDAFNIKKGEVENLRKSWQDDELLVGDMSYPEGFSLSKAENDLVACQGKIKSQKETLQGIQSEQSVLEKTAKNVSENITRIEKAINRLTPLDVVEQASTDGEVGSVPNADNAVSFAESYARALIMGQKQTRRAKDAYTHEFSEFSPCLSNENLLMLEPALCKQVRLNFEKSLENVVRDVDVIHSLFEDRIEVYQTKIRGDSKNQIIGANALATHVERMMRILHRSAGVNIPEEVETYGGLPILKFTQNRLKKSDANAEMMKGYMESLVDDGRTSLSGQRLISEALWKLIEMRGGKLNFTFLKPLPATKSYTYRPVTTLGSSSGGEGLTSALLLYFLAAKARNEEAGKATMDGGMFILDNPIGEANLPILLQTQLAMAQALGIQLIFFSGVRDQNSLSVLPRAVEFRPSKSTDNRTGRKFFEVHETQVFADAI